jgi:proton-translocating NADH-quinone oxidoreductase chain N
MISVYLVFLVLPGA